MTKKHEFNAWVGQVWHDHKMKTDFWYRWGYRLYFVVAFPFIAIIVTLEMLGLKGKS